MKSETQNNNVVNISDAKKFNVATKMLDDSRYFDALVYFARINGYESELNQIGCLCELGDFPYATGLYCQLANRYASTRDCYRDVAYLGGVVERVLEFFIRPPSYSLVRSKNVKERADLSKIRDFPLEFDNDLYCLWSGEFIEILEEFSSFHRPDNDLFYNVKSNVDHFKSIRRQMRQAISEGNFKKADEIKERLLELPAEDAESCVSKMYLYYRDGKFNEGFEVAKSWNEFHNYNLEGLDCAIRLSACVKTQEGLEYLTVFLDEIYKRAGEINAFNLRDYVTYAMELGNSQTALNLANALFGRFRDSGCLSLKICCVTYYNCRRMDLARDAVITLLNALPDDAFAQKMLEYVNEGGTRVKELTFDKSANLYFNVPREMIEEAQFSLREKTASQNGLFEEADRLNVRLLDCALKAATCRQDGIREILVSSLDNFSHGERLVELYKEMLSEYLPDFKISEIAFKKLALSGFRESALVSLKNDLYSVDFSYADGVDQTFIYAAAKCATVCKITLKQLKFAYRKLTGTLNLSHSADSSFINQVAYCLLAIGYKNFADSKSAKWFLPEERSLYADFLRLSQN